jgi:hypothetical protein
LRDFNAASAQSALTALAPLAGACLAVGDPGVTVQVGVTFAPSGKVSRAWLEGSSLAGKRGACVAAMFGTARVSPFKGGPVTLRKVVKLR